MISVSPRLRTTIAGFGLAMVVLSGCTPAPAPLPHSAGPPLALSSAIELTGRIAPDAILEGDCSQLLSDRAIRKISGTRLRSTPVVTADESPLERELEVLPCRWSGDGGLLIELTALRADLVAPTASSKCEPVTGGNADNTSCVFDSVAGGIRISGVVRWPTKDESREVAAHLVRRFERDHRHTRVGHHTAREPDAWNSRIVCDQLGPIEVGRTSINFVRDSLASGTLPVENQLAREYSSSGCFADFPDGHGGEVNIYLSAVADGAWRFDEVVGEFTDDGRHEAVEIDGFTHAARWTEGDNRGYDLVCGPNYLHVSFHGPVDDEAVLAALRERLVATSLA